MPVNVKPVNALAAIKKIGIPQAAYDWFAFSGYEVKADAVGFKFFTLAGVMIAHVDIKLQHLQQLMAGTLGVLPKAAIQEAIMSAIKMCMIDMNVNPATIHATMTKTPAGALGLLSKGSPEMKKVMDAALSDKAGHVTPDGGFKTGSFKAAVAHLQQLPKKSEGPISTGVIAEAEPGTPFKGSAIGNTTPPEPVQLVASKAWKMFDAKLMWSAKTVPLTEATELLQPVQGSSIGSRYFLMAAGKGLRVGCRYHSDQLSIRVEGDFTTFSPKCKSLGFDTVDPSKKYASIHLKVLNEEMANKTLGAIIWGLGLPFETAPIPVSIIKGMV